MKIKKSRDLLPAFFYLCFVRYFRPPYDQKSIEAQFKSLAKILHPDKGGQEDEFKRMIQERDLILEALKDQEGLKKKPTPKAPVVKKKIYIKIVHFDINDLIKKSLKL